VIFKQLELAGAYAIDLQLHEDNRGFFARSWCKQEFMTHGLQTEFVQSNISFNRRKGTLRGMHFQVQPSEEVKLVRVTRGALYDVIIDLRPSSKTYLKHMGVRLTSENRTMLYIPKGFAHGFLTLEDNTEISYQMSEFYNPEAQRGVRWNDPAFGIQWPASVEVISDRDNDYHNFH
jgi:dTDP-4-dehydrorhamnose 3,5-epimerase